MNKTSEDDDRENFPEDDYESCPLCGESHLRNEACDVEEMESDFEDEEEE